ncbi:MAG: glycosyltransferase family 2 protein [Lachnospiraceae bacterium]|nr:glycosyltransferase family 2 protein [Lachnospiraceae bacterium]
MDHKVLSVVVPMYQAEAYIERCLDSFLVSEPKVLARVEILVIDDGGTDGAAAIAQTYAEKYPDSYKVFRKENGGHGSGINYGIEHAKGTYFKVVDADDWVDTEAFGTLVKGLERLEGSKTDVDVVYTGFRWVLEGGQAERQGLVPERQGMKRTGSIFERRAESGEPFQSVVYGKLYSFDEVADCIYMKMHHMTIRTKILKEHAIRLDEHCYYVDMQFITFPIPYVKTICFLDESVYRYRIGVQGQSVAIKSMQRNEENYNRVIRSLLGFYSGLGTRIPCSEEKRRYIAALIARMAAGKAKILLSFPKADGRVREWRAFDEMLKAEYPAVYKANHNLALSLLRVTRYRLFDCLGVYVRRLYS